MSRKVAPTLYRSFDGTENRCFQRDARLYNNIMAFASLMTRDFVVLPRQIPGSFVLHGQTYHILSDAKEKTGVTLRYCQLYF